MILFREYKDNFEDSMNSLVKLETMRDFYYHLNMVAKKLFNISGEWTMKPFDDFKIDGIYAEPDNYKQVFTVSTQIKQHGPYYPIGYYTLEEVVSE